MKAGIVTALVTGGFALLYLFLSRMKKKQNKKIKDPKEVNQPLIAADCREKTESLLNADREIDERKCLGDKELLVISDEMNSFPDNDKQLEDEIAQPVVENVRITSESFTSTKDYENNEITVLKSNSDNSSDTIMPVESKVEISDIKCVTKDDSQVNENVEMTEMSTLSAISPNSELDTQNEVYLEKTDNPVCEFSEVALDEKNQSKCDTTSLSECRDESSKDQKSNNNISANYDKIEPTSIKASPLPKVKQPSPNHKTEASGASSTTSVVAKPAKKKKSTTPQKQVQEANAQNDAPQKLTDSSITQKKQPSPVEDAAPDKPLSKARRHKKKERKKAKESLEGASKDASNEQGSQNDKSLLSSVAVAENGANCPFANSNPVEAGELASTSDCEREASPEQENLMSDSHSLISQASVDSGQGSIEVEPETIFSSLAFPSGSSDQYIFYEFEIPQNLVGRLIGKKGTFVNKIKASTNASIVVLEHKNKKLKLSSLEGYRSQVAEALKMIRKQFPLNQFPDLTLEQVNTPAPSPLHQPTMDRQFLQVELPPGIVIETQVGCVCSAGEMWLQQPLHPSFAALQKLHHCINLNYGDGSTTPPIPTPIPPDTVCVCCIDSHWLRCITIEGDDESCVVNLLDIGGTVSLPISAFRQIRVDYMNLPFQASQCFLYGLQPPTAHGWEEEGRTALDELSKNTIIFASIAAYSEDGIPFVNLYKREFNEYVYLNKRLVELGHANWLATETTP